VYLERLHEFRDARESVERTSADGTTAERAVAWLRALWETWRAAEVPAERADLLHAVYLRIEVDPDRWRGRLGGRDDAQRVGRRSRPLARGLSVGHPT
jgi:hypothetical protein